MTDTEEQRIKDFLRRASPPEVRMSMTNQHWEGAIMMWRLIENEMKQRRNPFEVKNLSSDKE